MKHLAFRRIGSLRLLVPSPVLALLLAAAPSADCAPAAAQTSWVHVLLRAGDTVGPDVVESILAAEVSDRGTWAAIVKTVAGTQALVVDGAVELVTGGALAGEPVEELVSVRVSGEGVVGLHYRVPDPLGAGNSFDRVRIGAVTVVAEGTSATVPSLGLNGIVEEIGGFDFEREGMILACSVREGSAPPVYVFLLGSTAGGPFTAIGGYRAGDAVPGLVRPFRSAVADLDYAVTGRFGATFRLEGPLGMEYGLVYNGAGVGESGQLGPEPGSAWTFQGPPRIRVNRFFERAAAGTLDRAGVGERGVVAFGDELIAIEGEPQDGAGPEPVAAFSVVDLALTDDGDVFVVLPFVGGDERLMVGDETLVQSGVTAVGGDVVSRLVVGGPPGTLSVSGSGRVAVLVAELGPANESALLLVERDLLEPVLCQSTVNSTGVVGVLTGEGSRFLAINDLRLVASQLPPFQFSLLAVSDVTAFIGNPGGSTGNLCLGGSLGRYVTQIQTSGAGGTVAFEVDLTAIPRPSTAVSAVRGDTWHFQAWHRDFAGTATTSNFTAAVSVRVL